MKDIISHHDTKVNSLPRDFAEFLSGLPRGFVFSLWNVQGALRFTRTGIPNEQSYAPELHAAQQLGLIEPTDEDLEMTASEWERGYPRELHAGAQFRRTARKINLRSHTRVAPNARKQPIIFMVAKEAGQS